MEEKGIVLWTPRGQNAPIVHAPNPVSRFSGFSGSQVAGGPRPPNLRIEPRGAFRLTRNPFAAHGLTSSGGFLPAIRADRAGLLPGMPGYRDFQGFRASPGFGGYGVGYSPDFDPATDRSAGFQFFESWAHSPAESHSGRPDTRPATDPRIGAVKAADGPAEGRKALDAVARARTLRESPRHEAREETRWAEIGKTWYKTVKGRLATCADRGDTWATVGRWPTFLFLSPDGDVWDFPDLWCFPAPCRPGPAPVFSVFPSALTEHCGACGMPCAEWVPFLRRGGMPRTGARAEIRARTLEILRRGADVAPQYGTRHAIGSGSVDGAGCPGAIGPVIVARLGAGEAFLIRHTDDKGRPLDAPVVNGKAHKVRDSRGAVSCRYCRGAECPAVRRPGSQCPRALHAWERFPALRTAEETARAALRAHGAEDEAPAVIAARQVLRDTAARWMLAETEGRAGATMGELDTRGAEGALTVALDDHRARAAELRDAVTEAVAKTRAEVAKLPMPPPLDAGPDVIPPMPPSPPRRKRRRGPEVISGGRPLPPKL